jgi:hypothetical protein
MSPSLPSLFPSQTPPFDHLRCDAFHLGWLTGPPRGMSRDGSESYHTIALSSIRLDMLIMTRTLALLIGRMCTHLGVHVHDAITQDGGRQVECKECAAPAHILECARMRCRESLHARL